MTEHREVPVKVNAWVDEEIADLVLALSEIDGLVTLESCQGELGRRDAYVYFRFNGWRETGEFLFDKILPGLSPDVRAVTALRLQAYDSEMALGSITVEPSAISSLVECIRNALTTIRPRELMTRDAHRLAVAKGVTAA